MHETLNVKGLEKQLAVHADADQSQRHHLLIAGTGRAGTSALVRYLTGLGLETQVSRRGADAQWFEAAEAGLEDILISAISPEAPYVVKSPWSYQFVQETLDEPGIVLDAVIIPVRNLVDAAASRSIRELHEMHQGAPWMAELASTWEHWGTTPGGIIYSLNPVDVARLLAVGFHRLIERLVEADIPVILLAFPRFAVDPDYLYRKLAPALPISVPAKLAREVHEATFRTEKIRVDRELDAPDLSASMAEVRGPSFTALEMVALKREVMALREQQGNATVEQERTAEQLRVLAAERDALTTQRDALTTERDALATSRDVLAAECEAFTVEREVLHARLAREVARVAEAEVGRDLAKNATERERVLARDRLAMEQAESERERNARVRLEREIAALHASRSWRITSPLRGLGSLGRAALSRATLSRRARMR